MRETLKDLYSNTLFQQVTDRLKVYPAFDSNRFMELIHNEAWGQEEFAPHPAYYAGLNGHAACFYPEAVQILKQVARAWNMCSSLTMLK